MYSSLQRHRGLNVDLGAAATPHPPVANIPQYLRNNVSPQPRRSPYPHGSTLHGALGMPVPGAALIDPEGCAARDVPAYTDGLLTHFASGEPPLHVAAHEATHQLQHAGLTGEAGLGPERHAHSVANTVVAGGSAHGIIGPMGGAVVSATRDYTDFSVDDQNNTGQWKVGSTARVGDQGRTVTTDKKHECYAETALIEQANSILKAKKSGVRIEPGTAGPYGFAPDGSGFRTTVRVDYTIVRDEDNESFYADCGVSSREVMGESGKDLKPHGVYRDDTGARAETIGSYNPAHFRDEIFRKSGLGTTDTGAHNAYNALSETEKETFDQQYGINRFAAPGVGEAFTRRRDDELGGTGFNFHWGGVIMVAGGDRVTFENYTKGKGYLAEDKDWYFETYGPPSKPSQTWHERWKSVGGEGKGTTLAAATSADPSPFTQATASMATADIISRLKVSTDEGEKMALESALSDRWLKVTVLVKRAQEDPDEVYVTARHGGRTYSTGEINIHTGGKNTFWIPLSRLMPVSGKIRVEVYDSDVFFDDMISVIGFDEPYGAQSDNRPWDDALYHSTVEFDR